MITPRSYRVILAVIVLVGVVRIVATYRVFCETIDEPAHLAAGIEWLDRGTYAVDASHPPLARVMAAFWPYLSGIRSIKSGSLEVDGNHVLYAGNRYLLNLSRARAGILPFFIATVLVVAVWARRLWGDAGGLAAALLISNEPNILAHSGLTTTDMAAAATTVAAAYAFYRSLGDDNAQVSRLRPWSLWLGIAIGLALLAKFSTLLFVPVAFVAIAICCRRLPNVRSFAIAVLIAFVILLIGYRFDLGEFWQGIEIVRGHARAGHQSYLFGKFRQFGWWYYFPLAIGLKTTLGFLILFLVGAAASIGKRARSAPLVAGVAILIASLPVTINIGVRHVLPVYPFFAIVAAGAVVTYRRIGLALCAAAVIASLASHPDYLPYFNALAGPRPDRIFIDSNLDWGQDLLRLSAELRRRHIDSVALAYAGNAEPSHHNLPLTTEIHPLIYTPGWAAISEVLAHTNGPRYRWLERFNPVTQVGKSIRLYYLPPITQLMGGAPQATTTQTALLIPIWFEGTFRGANAWTCNLTIENEGGLQIPLRSVRKIIVPSQSTVTNPNFGLGDARDGAILYADRDDAAQLHFALTIRSATGQTVAMPVLRERDLLATDAWFASVPISDASAATLRIYDVTGTATRATVRMIDGNRSYIATIDLQQREAADIFPASTTIALNRLFPGRNVQSARIVVDAPSVSYWACVTVSERATNQAWVILPD